MTSLNDIANSVHLLKMRAERILKGAEDELLSRGTQHKQTRTGNKPKEQKNDKDFSIGSKLRDNIQHDTNVYPKPKETGKRMPGTASNKPESRSTNPTGDKQTRGAHNTQEVVSDAGNKLNTRTGRDRSSKLTGPKYYIDQRKKPGEEGRGLAVSTDEEKEKLRKTPGKDLKRIHGEMQDKKRQAQEKRERTRESKVEYDPVHSKESAGKMEISRPGKDFKPKPRQKPTPDSEKIRTDPGKRSMTDAYARSQLSHGSERRTRQRIGAETKPTRSSIGTPGQSPGKIPKDRPYSSQAKPDKDTKYFAASSQAESPQIDEKYHGKFKSLDRDARLALMRLERLEN